MSKKIMIITGEASGDGHGANLAKALRSLSSFDLEIIGIGGVKMREAGVKTFCDIDSLAIVGFADILLQFRNLRKIFLKTCRIIETGNLEALILIDYPGFNLRLADYIKKKKKKIPIIYYISPQVWAWGKNRVKKIAKLVDKMLVVFPFETEIYRQEGLPVEFVGHPLLDTLAEEEIKETTGTSSIPGKKLISLLPGSRKQEVKRLLPLMVKIAKLMKEKVQNLKFILPLASTISVHEVKSLIPKDLEVEVVTGKAYKVLAQADLALVASGTATLETACLGVPMIIIYKVSFLNWLLAKHLIKIPYLGLVNVVADRKIVPEFLQFEAQPEKIAGEALNLLSDESKRKLMKQELRTVREKLGRPGASRKAARLILEMINTI